MALSYHAGNRVPCMSVRAITEFYAHPGWVRIDVSRDLANMRARQFLMKHLYAFLVEKYGEEPHHLVGRVQSLDQLLRFFEEGYVDGAPGPSGLSGCLGGRDP